MKKVLFGILPAMLLVLVATSDARNYAAWRWIRPFDPVWPRAGASDGKYLTGNNGAHSVAMHEYNSGDHRLMIAATLNEQTPALVQVYEYEDIWDAAGQMVFPHSEDNSASGACIAAGPNYKQVVAGETYDPWKWWCAADALNDPYGGWEYFSYLTASGRQDDPPEAAIASQYYMGYDWVYAAHAEDDGDQSHWLYCSRSLDGGNNWIRSTIESSDYPKGPSLGVGGVPFVYCAYQIESNDYDEIWFRKSTNNGESWNAIVTNLTLRQEDEGYSPCLAASGPMVFVCWNNANGDNYPVEYRWSSDGGSTWHPDINSAPEEIADWENTPYVRHYGLNVVLIPGGNWGSEPYWHVLLMAQGGSWYSSRQGTFTVLKRGVLRASVGVQWDRDLGMSPYCFLADSAFCPSVCGQADGYDTLAACVWSSPDHGIYVAKGRWDHWSDIVPDPQDPDAAGRRLALLPDGALHYTAARPPYILTGSVLGNYAVPLFADCGSTPALAVDGTGADWLVYTRDDTVWCTTGGSGYEVVFAGSNSAVPGQPSIVCYPNQANGVYVGAVTFACYDTVQGTSMVLWARVDTSGVVLDTIESVANLGDSLPCINVYGDTLLVTWQHGTDSIMGSLLADYGPGTSGQPPAWSSPNLVTANGYHAMSRFDDNGTVLNVTWTRSNGSNYAIQRATCDLATTAFGNWSTMATPGDTGSYEKANPVFAGLGVSCYQQKDANGKWTIKGFVRGEEETFVANDTDAYHPHAVAESSAISPSIDQVRVHLLYTAGVTFEVDSGVLDTGDVRFVTCSLNVSHATSDATKSNNGSKFLRKNGSDSLFSVYSDLDNAVVFAWSATGDTWQRAVMASGREYPAIAEDSSGRRWVVVTKPLGVGNSAVEGYYRSGSSWVGPQTLYTNAMVPLGPASLAGASYTQSGIGYAAFLNTSGMTKSVILAKFDGTNVSTYTVATGASLGDPAVTVEPYKADSDHVHVTWTESGVLRYRMDTDDRSSSIADRWTSTYDLTGGGVTAQHPSINSDADQIVVAWAQGSPTDVYARKRSTDSAYNNWQTAVNLSNTSQNASDYPTIAMGDTVVVAWQELRTGGGDFDILASIDFGDTLNIADNATISTYPHVLFQNKASGDTAIPYLHTVWSEAAEYYEVGYNKLNLKEAEGEGQQAANLTPIPAKPMLEACRPNPFRGHTQISYALPTAGNVSLRVYDITGRTVRTLASGRQKAGFYSVSWDAKDSYGRHVPYGIYFYRLDTPGFRSVKKAVVAR